MIIIHETCPNTTQTGVTRRNSCGWRKGLVRSPGDFDVLVHSTRVSKKRDDLLKSLDKSGLEARIEDMDVGCVVYADDIVLLSPTVDGLQKMIDVSSSFANDHNLTFITVRNA